MAAWYDDPVTWWEGKKAEWAAEDATEEERWAAMEAKKDADFAAAAAEGLTPEEWYAKQGINPDGTPIKKPSYFQKNPAIVWGVAAAGVLFLLSRTK
jgi:hypothetical protein